MEKQAIFDLCRDCAREVYGTRPPTAAYAERTARLLIGTAATESHFQARRQWGLEWDRDLGAWGLWQSEAIAMYDNIELLINRRDIGQRTSEWIWGPGASYMVWRYMIPGRYSASDPLMRVLVRRLYAEDRFACAMARVHYLRDREPIPEGLREQAKYYKRVYNTPAGAGSVAKYLDDWRRHVAAVLGDA